MGQNSEAVIYCCKNCPFFNLRNMFGEHECHCSHPHKAQEGSSWNSNWAPSWCPGRKSPTITLTFKIKQEISNGNDINDDAN